MLRICLEKSAEFPRVDQVEQFRADGAAAESGLPDGGANFWGKVQAEHLSFSFVAGEQVVELGRGVAVGRSLNDHDFAPPAAFGRLKTQIGGRNVKERKKGQEEEKGSGAKKVNWVIWS